MTMRKGGNKLCQVLIERTGVQCDDMDTKLAEVAAILESVLLSR